MYERPLTLRRNPSLTDNGNYPAWTFPIAAFLIHLPVALTETLIFGSLAYWMAGLTPDASRFAFYICVAFITNIFAAATFRAFSYASPNRALIRCFA